jgi:hypothetical protein
VSPPAVGAARRTGHGLTRRGHAQHHSAIGLGGNCRQRPTVLLLNAGQSNRVLPPLCHPTLFTRIPEEPPLGVR